MLLFHSLFIGEKTLHTFVYTSVAVLVLTHIRVTMATKNLALHSIYRSGDGLVTDPGRADRLEVVGLLNSVWNPTATLT